MILCENKSSQSRPEFLSIGFEDPWFIVVAKPAGIATHPGRGVTGISMLEIMETQYQTKLYPLHRLDAATSGVLGFGRSRAAAQMGAALFRSQTARDSDENLGVALKKTYWALVRGHVPGSFANAASGDSIGSLSERGCIDSPVGTPPKTAITYWEGIKGFEVPWSVGRYPSARYALVKLYPVTGRTHQLRLHMHHWSHPIIGDTRYGDGAHNRVFRQKIHSHRLMLHCGEIRGTHPWTKEPFCWRAPLENTFQETLDRLANHRVF